MGKYDNLRILKRTKARTSHICNKCGKEIEPGEFYYRECINDAFLHTLHAKKYCLSCYEKYGNRLITDRKRI